MSFDSELLQQTPDRLRHNFTVNRRDLLKLFGAGLMVYAVDLRAIQESGGQRRNNGSEEERVPHDVASWIHVGADNKITVFTGKAEMGQNIRTSLAQQVAEELRAPMQSISMVMADTELCPFDMGTFGSRTTPTMTPQLRRVASAARDLLIEAAAKEWNVAPDSIKAADATLTEPASGRTLTYAALARGKTLAQNLPAEDPVTPPQDWTVAGKSLPKVDARDFVTGQHQYTPDLHPAGMLHGKVLRPPSFGATLISQSRSGLEMSVRSPPIVEGSDIGAM